MSWRKFGVFINCSGWLLNRLKPGNVRLQNLCNATVLLKALGPEHPRTATTLHNLAHLLEAKGNSRQAEPLYRRALAIREQALGPEHPAQSKFAIT
ncbi:MAG: tetratricopeptide repeat protein [Bryobacteraceae bacterium]|jgi:hypothetical protein